MSFVKNKKSIAYLNFHPMGSIIMSEHREKEATGGGDRSGKNKPSVRLKHKGKNVSVLGRQVREHQPTSLWERGR